MHRKSRHPLGSRPGSTSSRPAATAGGRAAALRFVTHPLLAATLALFWLLLQTGRKPSRISYPCQQAALRASWIAFGVALAPAFAHLAAWLTRKGTRLAAAATMVALLAFGGLTDMSSGQAASRRARLPVTADRATVFVVDNAGGPVGDHHAGIDRLFSGMGGAGLPFYRSLATGPESGPDGIIAAGDVVLLKVNQQWPERGGTNTDVLRGLIARILEHPDGFHGEVVVVENAQGLGRLDWPASNAENPAQSVRAVVDGFAGRGLPVSACLWDDLRATEVAEYSTGDLQDGYVLGALDQGTGVHVSYPKFRTAGGNRVSLKDGVWDAATGYDNARLKFIAVPVLKCHALYGVTGALKLHVGSMTTGLGTNTHAAVATGGLGTFLAEVRMPDLNILDCIYVLAAPGNGPAASYALATRVDKLVAGRDPVALDLWATDNILVPAILANGNTDYHDQDPRNPEGSFRRYLDATAARLLAAGIPAVTDLASIDAIKCSTTVDVPRPSSPSLGPHPNPFTSATVLRFRPRHSGATRVDFYDAAGRRWRSLPLGIRAGGTQEIAWDARDDDGRRVPPGYYYYRIAGAGEAMSGRVTVLP